MDFAHFAHLDPKVTQSLFEQESVRHQRDQIEVNSLGWVVAYLLVKLDPRLAGVPTSAPVPDGRAAATLAAASGWFPVPPLATALGLAEVAPSSSVETGKQGWLCRAAGLMEAGVETLRTSKPWIDRVEREPALKRQVAEIQSDVVRMRQDGNCSLGVAASL
jgi:hypothetical protein